MAMTRWTLDGEAVAGFLATVIPGFDHATFSWEAMGGGSSNPTFLLRANGRDLVLRHPPAGYALAGAGAHDMAREYRVIAALNGHAPVPGAIGLCEDPAILGVPFYVMTYVQGEILGAQPPVQPIPAGYADTAAERRRIGEGMIETLAQLHAVDYRAVGLGQFGRPEGYVERQVKRWTDQWNAWKTQPCPEMEDLLRRLARAIPAPSEATIVHGDYRLGNLILAPDNPGRVVAILDWEMATLGDPIADLGYTMVYWGEPGDHEGRFEAMDLSRVTALPGFMTRAELVSAYAARTGRNVDAVDFFEMLARSKLAVFEERGRARARAAGLPENPEGRLLARVREALAVGDASEDPRLHA